jgi:hypothetical protein
LCFQQKGKRSRRIMKRKDYSHNIGSWIRGAPGLVFGGTTGVLSQVVVQHQIIKFGNTTGRGSKHTAIEFADKFLLQEHGETLHYLWICWAAHPG